jgi:hypothetical protein
VEANLINDSVPWKDDLLRVAEDLKRRKTQRRWSERSNYLFERNVMTATYSIRKLIEAHKVSNALARKSWPVEQFKPNGPVPDAWNHWEPQRLFDLASPSKSSLSTMVICHQIVHSYLFFPIWKWDDQTRRRGELDALSFTSDTQRRKGLFAIRIDTLIALIAEVGDEEVIHSTMRANPDGERYIAEVIGVGRGDPRHWSRRGAPEARS